MYSSSKKLAPAWWTAAVACLVCILAGSTLVLRAQGKTSKDGVYSAVQSKRGETLFQAKCASCHAKDLSGGDGPALAGSDFLGFWDKMPWSELVDKIATSMPDDAPGTTTRAQAADLVAFILQSNKFPAGQAALSADNAILKTIKIAK